ncbi:LBF_2127 family putative lipoprotein [Leptospira terpstrae]|uniref:LBF_2127 family putative lipoprotein n=1 Tax=Leptospira terpstrae TaxID=293075 RepID=UPI003D050E1D
MKSIIYCIILFSLIHCSVDLRQVPPPSPNGNLNRPLSNLPLVIGKFEILSADRGVYTDAWRMAFKGHLTSSGLFSTVATELDSKLISDFYTIDVEMKTLYNDKYNWWFTFPAVYPFTGIWPIQYRIAEYSVDFKYKLYKNKTLIKEEEISKTGKADEFLYGFYKVRNFQRMIEETNLEAVNTCIKNLSESL